MKKRRLVWGIKQWFVFGAKLGERVLGCVRAQMDVVVDLLMHCVASVDDRRRLRHSAPRQSAAVGTLVDLGS